MLPNMKPRPNAQIFLKMGDPGLVTKAPPKYTVEDWDFSNRMKFRIACEQERLVDRIKEDSRRVIDEVSETTASWQRDVEHYTKERTDEIRFLCDELNKQKKTAMVELDALTTYRNRVVNAINFLAEKSLAICKQCIIWREGRIGVDFCDDEVDRELCRELKTIKGCQELMDKTLKDMTEQIRSLCAAMALLDEDLQQKSTGLLIDEKNLRLRQANQDLGVGQDLSQHHCQYSLSEWEQRTYRNIDDNAKILNSAAQLRAYIDLLLVQVCEDMFNQTERTNGAFERRIREVKHVKQTLEDQHNKIMGNIMDIDQNIKIIEAEIKDKDRAMLLCKTRLSNRAQRKGLESTCDTVQLSLYEELSNLQATMCKLNQKKSENVALKRYLMHVQIVLEEDINVKLNDIKIDEVDCMNLREALVYTNF